MTSTEMKSIYGGQFEAPYTPCTKAEYVTTRFSSGTVDCEKVVWNDVKEKIVSHEEAPLSDCGLTEAGANILLPDFSFLQP